MPWALLLDLRVLLGIALVGMVLYAATQRLGWQQCKAEYAQFRADTDRLASEAKVRNAQEAARQAQNAQEALDGLQTRYDALNARYRVLRSSAGSSPVPSLSSAATIIAPCPDGRDAAARLLAEVESRITAITEAGDRELAKYNELWRLQEKNSANPL